MEKKRTEKIIFASLFAAMICVTNIFIHIPIPSGNGYLNLGDAFSLAGAVLLGPYGIVSAATGGILSDLLGGYSVYIPATAVIKAISAAIAFLLHKRIKKYAIPFLAGELIVPFGYLLYESAVMRLGRAAVVNLPFNIVQFVTAVIIALILIKPLKRIIHR